MPHKTVFLSHIHEEKEFAILIKNAIEDEFGGFVEVFVSSDGTSIPAGSNFLKRIEKGLLSCDAAVYLISQNSVKRNWINFELGAIWIRSLINEGSKISEIPLLPICHSGATPSSLPAPLNNLNAISGTESSQLEFAFASIQNAIGGRGRLRTDFDSLARKMLELQRFYLTTSNLVKVFKLIGVAEDFKKRLDMPEDAWPGKSFILRVEDVEKTKSTEAKAIIEGFLEGVTVKSLGVKSAYGPQGAISMESLEVEVPVGLIYDAKNLL